jgi:hypothetical protein
MRYYWELSITELGRINREVRMALKTGQLKQQPCAIKNCNVATGNTVAHHEDYDKPLDITWLCKRHHRLRHAQLNKLRPNDYIINPKPKPEIPTIKDVIKLWPDGYELLKPPTTKPKPFRSHFPKNCYCYDCRNRKTES